MSKHTRLDNLKKKLGILFYYIKFITYNYYSLVSKCYKIGDTNKK